MGKISEAIQKGRIEGNNKYPECGDKPILVKTKEILDVEEWDKKKLKLDPEGYFLFGIEENWIYAGFVNTENEMIKIFRGKKAIDMFKAILKKGLVSNLDHSAYIGYELGKCEKCLEEGKEYIQS